MSISKYPSKLSLPAVNPGVSSVLEYLLVKFPRIEARVWEQRMAQGKVHWHDGSLITAASAFEPQQRVYYYREVTLEPEIPFEETILFQDEHILVVHKPHFLPVTPGGKYINECLQNRLRAKTGLHKLQSLHRLDRVTAGLVLFSVNPHTRHRYHHLFESHQIHKSYQAISRVNTDEYLIGQQWEIKNRIVKSKSAFRMHIVDGEPNSHSMVRCLDQWQDKALFELAPITGKTHQLRLHMQALGWPILHDRYYPDLQPESADCYSQPLQLLAKKLQFIDPVTQLPRHFCSHKNLSL